MATIVTRAGKGSPLTNTEMDSNLTTLSTSIFNGTSNVAVNSSNGAATITTAGTTAVTIDTSQNVGIGVTSPSARLHVVDSGGGFFFDGTNGTYNRIKSTTTSVAAGKDLFFTTNDSGNAGMYLNSSGNLGVGITSPSTKLHVASGQGTIPDFTVQGSGSSQGWMQFGTVNGYGIQGGADYLALIFRTNGSERSRIDNNGNWLLGTTSVIGSGKASILFSGATQNAVEVQDSGTNSGAAFASFRNSGGTQIGSITRNGTTNAVLFNTTSDQRLKSNITDSDVVLDKLLTVKVRQFDWTEGDLHQDYGFIAQELEPILSGVVTKGKAEEDTWQLDYSRLTPMLVKAIQEQQALITQLQADVAALTAK